MKQYILLLVLMVMGAGIHAYAEDYHIDCGNRARYGE